jgi:hypothetical protein
MLVKPWKHENMKMQRFQILRSSSRKVYNAQIHQIYPLVQKVWLHGCLDGYSCLLLGECLRHSWYGCYDVV